MRAQAGEPKWLEAVLDERSERQAPSMSNRLRVIREACSWKHLNPNQVMNRLPRVFQIG